ncbi:MAG TPA: hypothetical protein VIU02_01885 [Burkholderiales bacterium]
MQFIFGDGLNVCHVVFEDDNQSVVADSGYGRGRAQGRTRMAG